MGVRVAEVAAIVLIGDGVVGALFPARHARRWLREPAAWRRAMSLFVEHPRLTRIVAAAQIVAGVGWVAQLPSASRRPGGSR